MGLDDALGRLDVAAIARDAGALVQVPSVTGDERAALERLAELAAALGLRADLHRHDLAPCGRTRTTRARRPRAPSCGG
jgi:acetylornithine deacetylase